MALCLSTNDSGIDPFHAPRGGKAEITKAEKLKDLRRARSDAALPISDFWRTIFHLPLPSCGVVGESASVSSGLRPVLHLSFCWHFQNHSWRSEIRPHHAMP